MRKLFISCLAVGVLIGGCQTIPPSDLPVAVLETEKGNIEIEVYTNLAPISSQDFLTYVDEGYYDAQGFYRVVRADNDPRDMGMSLIQGGRLDSEPLTEPLEHETTKNTGLSNMPGTISIARGDPGTGNAAYFFINVGDNSFLDYGGSRNPDGQGYAVFGKVIAGMDVVREIQAMSANAPSDSEATQGQILDSPVIIKRAYRK